MKISKMCRVVVLFSLIIFPSVSMAEDLPKFLFLATNPQGSLFYTFGSIFGKILDGNSGMSVRVQPSGGSSAYIPAISQGKADLGVNNTNDVMMAYTGQKPFIRSPNVRVVTAVAPLIVGILVKNDSDIKTLEQIKGKRVAAKFPAQLSVEANIRSMMATVGLTWGDVEEIPVTNIIEGAQALAENRLDVTSIAISAGKTKEINATIPGGVRYLSINDSPEAARKMDEEMKGTYPILIKANAPGTVGMITDTVCQAYDIFVIAGKHLSNDAVYAITKTIYENEKEVQKGHGMLGRFNTGVMVKANVTAPYHDGAITFYKEVGLWSAEMDKVQENLLQQAAN